MSSSTSTLTGTRLRHDLPGTGAVRQLLGPIADDQHGVVRGAQARDLLGRPGLAAAQRSGGLVRLWHGAYALPPVSLDVRLHAADLTLGATQTACLETAAALYGFDLSGEERLHLLAGTDAHSRRPELALHRLQPLRPLMRFRDRPLMDATETAIRLAAAATTEQHALAVLDAALSSRAVARVDQLVAFAQQASIRGIRTARRVAQWADPGPESPRESWLRWVLLDAGLPPPEVQFWVEPRPGRRYRLDLAWPRYKIACEYDGVEFHTGEALFRDRQRLNDLTADRWLLTFASGIMVTRERHLLVSQVADMLRSRGAAL